jgi:hypothetical protein
MLVATVLMLERRTPIVPSKKNLSYLIREGHALAAFQYRPDVVASALVLNHLRLL